MTAAPGFSKPEFFNALTRYAVENPPPASQYLQASALVLDGYLHQSALPSAAVTQANDAMIAESLSAVTEKNAWSFNLKVGHYGTDYLLRAAVAKYGFAGNDAADAVSMRTATDITNAPLDGNNSYVIHFALGQTPPAHGYWSITVYNQNGFLVANPINRYSLGSQSGLVQNPDGSLDIFLQNSEPPTLQSNWLPVPVGPFNLSLRIYWPDQTVLNGTWTPPTLNQASAVAP